MAEIRVAEPDGPPAAPAAVAVAAEGGHGVAPEDPNRDPSLAPLAEEEEASMTPTEEEVGWAQAVKAAALEDASLQKLSDYKYLQHAMFTKGNVEQSLFQIEGLQQFKEEYNINDTAEEGCALLRQLHEQQPWFLLDIGYEPEGGHFVIVCDYKELKPEVLRMPNDWRIFLGGLYYCYQICSSNLHSTREGIVSVGEIDGMGWNNFSVDLLRTFWHHMMEFYPLQFKEVSWMHDNVIANLFNSLHRSVMGEQAKNFRIGVRSTAYDGRLDSIFKVPTPEIALQRLMDRYMVLLSKRYEREQSFQLPPIDPALTENAILAVEDEGGGDEENGDEQEE